MGAFDIKSIMIPLSPIIIVDNIDNGQTDNADNEHYITNFLKTKIHFMTFGVNFDFKKILSLHYQYGTIDLSTIIDNISICGVPIIDNYF